jgi:hypothetical protein
MGLTAQAFYLMQVTSCAAEGVSHRTQYRMAVHVTMCNAGVYIGWRPAMGCRSPASSAHPTSAGLCRMSMMEVGGLDQSCYDT